MVPLAREFLLLESREKALLFAPELPFWGVSRFGGMNQEPIRKIFASKDLRLIQG